MSLGPLEIILIVAVVALIFGAKKLPELGKGVGQGIREFKREVKPGDQGKDAVPLTDVRVTPLDPAAPHPASRPAEVVTERDHRA